MGGRFTVTPDHLKLLSRAYFRFQDDYESGAAGIDQKRPYGNSDVPRDVAEILGWEFDEDEGPSAEQTARAWEIHRDEIPRVLQIIVRNLSDSRWLGEWDGGEYGFQWTRVGPDSAPTAPTVPS